METNTLTFTISFSNLQTAIDNFINDLISTYKSFLIRDNKKASGNLISSIKSASIQFSNNKISADISLAKYWKYVEYGRKPGKFPPPNKISKWIKVKPIKPRPINGIKPNKKQLTFLISRKIAKKGIQAGNQFSDALDLVWNKHKDNISNAISLDLEYNIDLIKI